MNARRSFTALLVVLSCSLGFADPPSKDYPLFWADELDGKKLDLKKW